MGEYRSDLLRILEERGFIFQITDPAGLDELALAGPVTGYIGFDCTAPSLHVGSLVPIMMLRWMQKTGHKPIVLLGGGTSKVGDPSGKDESRRLIDEETIRRNMAGIRANFEPFLTFGEGETDALLVDNAEWLDELKYIPFLREIGRHFTINRMLTFDSVRLRLEREQPLTFLEFNYMILQAYDFVELARRYGCRLQMGGSDQWGNIVNGIDLGRRMLDLTLYGLTSPLITTADGRKMGKTAEGAIWLSPEQLSAYDYYQYWRNVQDADVGRFLRLFTELPMDEIHRLEALEGAEINEAKKVLAFEATRLCRGEQAAREAAETARRTFEAGDKAEGLPSVVLTREEISGDGLGVLDLFVRAGLAGSKKEVRRLIAQGGARIDDQPITDEGARLRLADLEAGPLKLSAGRKRHALLRLAE
ncbi:MAG: tyrosine--tRNA ligase [Alphaproteobacteria bacterium]|nr:MAG: tyrosine--tRNA ligase [Alphaproteobacteria bacterium]